jgi:cytoskeletal protein RodZ
VTDEQLDELISCYLDGELSQQESQLLESRLQSDPEAARRLRIMKEARKALVETPAYRLPDNFAARVLLAAQKEAERLGLPADHPIRLAETSQRSEKSVQEIAAVTLATSAANSTPVSSKKSNPWSWAYAAAAAAAVLMGGVIWWQSQTPSHNSSSEQLAQDDTAPKPGPVTEPNTGVPPQPREILPESETRLATNGDNSSDSEQSAENKTDSKPSENKPDVATIANNDSTPDNIASKPDAVTPPSPLASEAEMLKNLASDGGGNVETMNVLMVIDIAMTKEAWESQAFSKIVNEYGIRYDRPIVADESLNKALENSKLVAKAGTDATPVEPVVNGNTGDVQLVFVQARAARIDNAIKDIFERIDEFPSLYFDLSMDGPCQDVVNRMEAFSPFENDGEEVFGIATAVQNGNANNANVFAGAQPRGNAVPLAARQNKHKALADDPVSMNPVSTVLFILRKPEGAEGRP